MSDVCPFKFNLLGVGCKATAKPEVLYEAQQSSILPAVLCTQDIPLPPAPLELAALPVFYSIMSASPRQLLEQTYFDMKINTILHLSSVFPDITTILPSKPKTQSINALAAPGGPSAIVH